MNKRIMNIETELSMHNNILGLTLTLNSSYDYYQLISFLSEPIEKNYDNWFKIWPKKIFVYKDNKNIKGFDIKTYDDIFSIKNDDFEFLKIDSKPKFRVILNSYIDEYNKFKNLINI